MHAFSSGKTGNLRKTCLFIGLSCLLICTFALPLASAAQSESGTKPSAPTAGTAEAGSGQSVEVSAELARILTEMETRYETLKTYRAAFLQESETMAFRRLRQSSGKIFFKKPDSMRFSYTDPQPREVYLKGNEITLYQPDKKQVIRQSGEQTLPGIAPARLFMGLKALQETFSVALEQDNTSPVAAQDCLRFRLTPRNRQGASIESILLWVGKSDLLPRKTESRDVLGNRTTLTFSDWHTNVPLEKGLFQFVIPQDAEILENVF